MAIITVNTDNIGSPDYTNLWAALSSLVGTTLTEDVFINFTGEANDTSLSGNRQLEITGTSGYRVVIQGDRDVNSVWDDSKVTIEINDGYCRFKRVAGLEMRDVQVETTGTATWPLYLTYYTTLLLDNVYMRAGSGYNDSYILHGANTGGELYINNCIMLGAGAGQCVRHFYGPEITTVLESVINNWDYGVSTDAASPNTIFTDDAVFGNVTADFDSDVATSGVNYCASDDAYGQNNVNPADWDVIFVDQSSGNFELLITDTTLRGSGSTGNNIGWDQSSAATQYTLTYIAGAGGTIVGTTPQTVDEGASGTLVTATPNSGYSFTDWSDGILTAGRQDGPISGDITVSGYFAASGQTYTLTYTAGSGGYISGVTPQEVIEGNNGTEVAAISNFGYTFDAWSDSSPTFNRTDGPISGDLEANATFTKNEYTLTYIVGPEGYLSGVTPQTIEYLDDGTAVEATPYSGYRFSAWSDNILTANRQDLNISGNITVSGSFEPDTTFVWSYLANSGGHVDGDILQFVPSGDNATAVAAIPMGGFEFLGWHNGDAGFWNQDTTRADLDVQSDRVVTAMFGSISRYSAGDFTIGSGGDFIDPIHAMMNQDSPLTGDVKLTAINNLEIYTRWNIGNDENHAGFEWEFDGAGHTLYGIGARQHLYVINVTNAPKIIWHDYTLRAETQTTYAHRGSYARKSHLNLVDYNSHLIVSGVNNPPGHPWYIYGGTHDGDPIANTSLTFTYYNSTIHWDTTGGDGRELFETDYDEPTKIGFDVQNIGVNSPNDSLVIFRALAKPVSGVISNCSFFGFSDDAFVSGNLNFNNIMTSDDTGNIQNIDPANQYVSMDPDSPDYWKPIEGTIAATSGTAPTLSSVDMNGTAWAAPYPIGPVQYVSSEAELSFSGVNSQEDVSDFNITYPHIISYSGVDSQESMSDFTITYPHIITYSGIDSQESVSEFTITYPHVISYSGVDSQESVSNFTITYPHVISYSGIDSQEDVSEFNLSYPHVISYSGIDSQESVSTFTLIYYDIIDIPGVDSQESISAFNLIYPHVITISGIDSVESISNFNLSYPHIISYSGIDSQEDVSEFSLTQSYYLNFNSVDSQEDISDFTLVYPHTIGFTGIDSVESISPFTILKAGELSFRGVDSEESISNFNLVYPHFMSFDAIDSVEDVSVFNLDYVDIISVSGIDGQESISEFTLVYSHPLRFNGVDSVQSISDFTITYPNTPPIANDDAIRVAISGSANRLVGGAYSVLDNDIDPNQEIMTASLYSGVYNGSLVLNSNGTFLYTHNGSANLSDSFLYRAYDGIDYSNIATVSITVSASDISILRKRSASIVWSLLRKEYKY